MKLGGKQELCPECGEVFTGTRAGDKHRTGKHHITSGPHRRRCLSVDEMLEKGMARNHLGIWMASSREQEDAA